MRPTLLTTLFLFATIAYSQTPIADARSLSIGTQVTINGIVTSGSEFGSIRYVQDATAGIAVFPGTGSISGFSPTTGTNVTLTGTLKNYFGLLELDPVSAFTINSTGNALPSPQLISPSQLNESVEGELVHIPNCTFTNAGGTFSSGTDPFTSNGQSGAIFLRTGHPLIGTTIPFGLIDVVGIGSQYTTSGVGGYQLLPRTSADFITSNTITLTSAVSQTDILPYSFRLNWNTNIAGSNRVEYGLNPSMVNSAITSGNTTSHYTVVPGLSPATFYYARCLSIAGNDTAFSPVGYYSTASEQPGTIKAYFNHSVDNSVALVSNAISLDNLIDDTVRAYIDRAQYTLEYAVYNTTHAGVVTSLNAALARGVQIRIIAEGSNSNSAFSNLNAAIPVFMRQNSQGSGMHNKFMAIDADDPNNAFLVTGSTNYTNGSFYTDANNLVIVKDQALARCYRMEFNEMWGGAGPQPNAANSKFGANKADNTPHLFNVGGSLIESRFSPSDNTTNHIEVGLRTADVTIEFALFAFTMNQLKNALIEVEALPGRVVRGVTEASDIDMNVYQGLLAGGVDVHMDGDPNSYLHHKYAIVDRAGSIAQDPLVITGSHNWSFNAESVNDENTLIIHNATIADHFYQEWFARWNMAVGMEELLSGTISTTAWPNPVRDVLNVQFDAISGGMLGTRVIDATGRVVMSGSNAIVPGSNRITFNVNELAPGPYVIRVDLNDHSGQQVFIVE